jgi:hypothetical protein
VEGRRKGERMKKNKRKKESKAERKRDGIKITNLVQIWYLFPLVSIQAVTCPKTRKICKMTDLLYNVSSLPFLQWAAKAKDALA